VSVRWLSRAVSIMVIALVVVAGWVLLRSSMPATTVGQNFETWALFRDGSRLATSSPVMIAGVRVGEVSRLTVVGDFARVDMRLRDDSDIPIDSWVTKRAESAFGDSYIEIIPTGGEEGAPTARKLKSGEQLVHVMEGSSTDTVLRAIAKTMPKIDQGLDAVHDFAMDGRTWVTGPAQDRILDADKWIAAGHISDPIEAADRAVTSFESGTQRAADAVAGAKSSIPSRLDDFDKGIAKAQARMADVKKGISEGLANAREGMDRIDPTVNDMREYLAAINQGKGDDFKGRFGRLINDPELGDEIDDLAQAGADGAASLNKFKAWLGVRFEYNFNSGLPRAYATAEIRARVDKFFLIELSRDPFGDVPADQLADAANAPQFTRTQQLHDGIRFTAQFGKTMWDRVNLRGGIKESTFGLGSDFLVRNGDLRLSADLFGGFDRVPRLKLAAALQVFKGIYILGGVDDALNRPRDLSIITGNTDVPTYFSKVRIGRDFFAGATLQFTDADLAALLRIYGALIVGLL
jgi:ABC-type transporter Mla subunit MlaD